MEHPLVLLLLEDGVLMPDTPGHLKRTRCWFQEHEHEAMDVDTISGLFNCTVCRAEGNVWTYLLRARRETPVNARATLEGLGSGPEFIEAVQEQFEEIVERRQLARLGRPRHVSDFDNREHIVSEHEYLAADRDHICTVVRYQRKPRTPIKGSLPQKACFVPASHGGWWRCDPDHRGLPEEDAWLDKIPLYGLPVLDRVTKAAPVVIVDHEHHAVAINRCRKIPALCPFNGHGSDHHRIDWTPLSGRNVFIVANAHPRSRRYMRRLAQALAPLVNGMKIALPPGDTRYGVADAAADDLEHSWRSIRGWLDPLLKDMSWPADVELTALTAVLHTPVKTIGPEFMRMSLAALMHKGWTHEGSLILDRVPGNKGYSTFRDLAAERGWRFHGGRLFMALRCKALHELVKESPYPDLDIDETVLKLPGVKRYRNKAGTVKRMRFAGKLYACAELPWSAARKLRLFHATGEEIRD